MGGMKMSENPEMAAAFNFGRHFKARMISGLLIAAPLVITLFIFKVVLSALTSFVMPVVRRIPLLGSLPQGVLVLASIAALVLLVYLIGASAANWLGRRVFHLGETLVLKVPIVKSVYAASKQVMETFSNPAKTAFASTVFVSFPHPGSKAVGFVTGTMTGPEGDLLYCVFVATSPNPTSGFLLMLPEEEICFTDIPVEEGIKMTVSGGMIVPKQYARRRPGELFAIQAIKPVDT